MYKLEDMLTKLFFTGKTLSRVSELSVLQYANVYPYTVCYNAFARGSN